MAQAAVPVTHRTELEAVLSTCVSVAERPAVPAPRHAPASAREPIASHENLPPFADPAAPAVPET
ncbi:hypothetical protein ACFQE0_24530 [Methylobacterium komagatae]|uniref:Uncharacterized protein n=1 Tax=Methylobacterium komagatae TaxID=374425 RepID=A0ABW2BQI7_9HYPH